MSTRTKAEDAHARLIALARYFGALSEQDQNEVMQAMRTGFSEFEQRILIGGFMLHASGALACAGNLMLEDERSR